MKIIKSSHNHIKIINSDGGFIESQSVEANLLFKIHCHLEKIIELLKTLSSESTVALDENSRCNHEFVDVKDISRLCRKCLVGFRK